MSDNFVHLHAHSEFSSLDGFAKITKSVERAKEYGQPAIAITDHGVTNGWVKFWKECKKNEIKPILGVEAYIVDDMRRRGLTESEKERLCKGFVGAALRSRTRDIEKALGLRKRYHCILLAKDYVGFRNINRLVTLSHREGFYYRPRIDFNTLFQYKDGIIVTSGCMSGKIPQLILAAAGETAYADDTFDVDLDSEASSEDAEDVILLMKEQFKDDFYFEIQSIDMDVQSIINSTVALYAEEFDVPIVATNDIHYVDKNDCVAHDVLLAIQSSFGKRINNINDPNRWRFDTQELWLKDRKQMLTDFMDFNQKQDLSEDVVSTACDNTLEVADKIKFRPWDRFSDPKVTPSVYLPKRYYPHSYESAKKKTKKYQEACERLFWDWCLDGWKRKIKGKVPKGKLDVYKKRLLLEFKMVKELEFLEYFIIIADLIKWAKGNGIVVGPSRGSSASSLICYLTDITEIDPIPWNLLFERFISPNRTDNPDVDIDFDPNKREEVKKYLFDKYGEARVALVGSNILFKGRMVLADVARVYGIKPKDIDEVKKLVLQRSGADRRSSFTLLDSMEEFDVCKKFAEEHPEIITPAAELEGQVKAFGVHAGGVLIADKPLWNYTSIRVDNKGGKRNVVAAVDKHDIEDIGLLKIDILGVDELTMIDQAAQLVKERHGVDVSPWELPYDDKGVFETTSNGETVGVFQLHSKGITRLCQAVQPDSFEDLAAITALHRPGPLMSGAAQNYGKLKRGDIPRRNWHPIIQKICEDTYGEILYQEQLMAIVRECAGFSWKQTGDLRKTISKNVGVEYFHDTYGPPWYKGCWENKAWIDGLKEVAPKAYDKAKKSKKALKKLSDKIAKKTFLGFMNFGSWSMNKCHAISYARISYVSMWFKTYYPLEFMTACIEVENDEEHRRELIREIKRMGIDIYGPDCNRSRITFSIENDGIRCGLQDVKGVGTKACESIRDSGPYKSIFDFCRKVNRRVVHKGVIRSLVCAGTFEGLHPNTKRLLENLDVVLSDAKTYKDGKSGRASRTRKSWKKIFASTKNVYSEEDTTRLKEQFTTMVQGDPLITFYDGFLNSLEIPYRSVAEVGEIADSGDQVKEYAYIRTIMRSVDLKRYSQEVNYVVGKEDDFRYCLLDLEDETDFIMGSCRAEVYLKYEKKIWEWGTGTPILVKGQISPGRRKIFVIGIVSLDELRGKIEQGDDLDWNEKSMLRVSPVTRNNVIKVRQSVKSLLNGKTVTCENAWNKNRVTVIGYVAGTNVVSTKKDQSKKMIFSSIEDETGMLPIMVWPNDTIVNNGWPKKVFQNADEKGLPIKIDLRRLPGNEQYPETKFVLDYSGPKSIMPITKKNLVLLRTNSSV